MADSRFLCRNVFFWHCVGYWNMLLQLVYNDVIGWNQKSDGQYPGNGAGQSNAYKAPNVNHDQGGYTAANQLQNACCHSGHAIAKALNAVAHGINHHKRWVKQGVAQQELRHKIQYDGFGGIQKQQGNITAEKDGKGCGKGAEGKPQRNGTPIALFHAVDATGSQILSTVGGHSGTQRVGWRGEKGLGFSCCRHGCHGCAAKGVGHGLHDNGTNGRNGKLQRHRQADKH